MTDLTMLAEELRQNVMWQVTPSVLAFTDYIGFIINGLKRLFTDTNRPYSFSKDKIIKTRDRVTFADELDLIEERYVLICAQIDFFKRVQTDVNVTVSYTTDALSVTGGDKPYAHLKDSIEKLEQERRILYYKMVAYTIGAIGD